MINYFKGKNVKTKSDRHDLADEFEKEMDKQMDSLLHKEEQKYLQSVAEPADTMPAIEAKEPVQQMNQQDEIDYEIEDTDSDEELNTGLRCKKKKPQFTNDELFYDPNMDDGLLNFIFLQIIQQ